MGPPWTVHNGFPLCFAWAGGCGEGAASLGDWPPLTATGFGATVRIPTQLAGSCVTNLRRQATGGPE